MILAYFILAILKLLCGQIKKIVLDITPLFWYNMLLYNWNKIFTHCESNPVEMVRVFRMLVEKQIPNNRYDKIYKYSNVDFSGDCFLIHPDVLLYNSYKYSYRDICVYVALASKRSYAEYRAFGKRTLDIIHLPEGPIIMEDYSLLYIEDEEIHFVYEEDPTEKH